MNSAPNPNPMIATLTLPFFMEALLCVARKYNPQPDAAK
jgi:hypothetical protein